MKNNDYYSDESYDYNEDGEPGRDLDDEVNEGQTGGIVSGEGVIEGDGWYGWLPGYPDGAYDDVNDDMQLDEYDGPLLYKIILDDGSTIDLLTMNGNNFVSQEEITEDMFADKMSRVTIMDSDGNAELHEDMELVQIAKYGEEWYFIIRDIPDDEKYKMKIEGDIDYIAMMAGIEL